MRSPFIVPIEDINLIRSRLGDLPRLLTNKSIFVTGGTGFIGKWLLTTLIAVEVSLQLGLSITVLTRNAKAFRSQFPELVPDFVELMEGDVTSFDMPRRPYFAAIHAATDVETDNDALITFNTCVEGTRRVLDLCSSLGCERFLLLSSGAVYGPQPRSVPRMSEEHPCAPDPASAYSSGKFAAEWIARAYAKKFKLNVAIARCYAFVGPFLPLDRQFAIGNFIRSVMDDQPVLINGNGTPIRSYLYSADLAVWLITLLLRVEGLDVVNVGGDEAVTIHELAERVIRVLGSDSPIYLAEVPQSSTVGTRYVPDISRITERYGLKPTVSLDLAIFRTAQWHISRSK